MNQLAFTTAPEIHSNAHDMLEIKTEEENTLFFQSHNYFSQKLSNDYVYNLIHITAPLYDRNYHKSYQEDIIFFWVGGALKMQKRKSTIIIA